MNIGSGGDRSDLYQTNFYGMNPPPVSGIGNHYNLRFNFYTNVINLNYGGSFGNLPSNSKTTKHKKSGGIGSDGILGATIRSIWTWVTGIFKQTAKVGRCPLVNIDISIEDPGGLGSMTTFGNDLLYDLTIPFF